MNHTLTGISGPLQDATFSLNSAELSIGRDPANGVSSQDPALSRHHCLIKRNGQEFIIRDLGSRNGTTVNGIAVHDELQLRHGDQVSVGGSVLMFLVEEYEEARPANAVDFTETQVLGTHPVLVRAFNTEIPAEEPCSSHLDALIKLATHIGGIRDLQSLEWQVLGFVFDIVAAERGAFLLFESPDTFSSAVAWDRVGGPDRPVRVSRTILRRVLRERTGLVVTDVLADEGFRVTQTVTELHLRSVLCVPLIASETVLGAIYLDTQHRSDQFDESHLAVMTAVAGVTALALDNLRRVNLLQKENQDLRAEINAEHNILGGSEAIRKVLQLIRRIARTETTVLIQGESGTGKELAARAIHRNSGRAERILVAINCAAIPETLLESELFGHEKGAFTGASALKKGKLESAIGGTLFLDEIGELAPALQSKLLRVLQEREFERVGGTHPIKLDTRILAASNKNLADLVKADVFRNDLYQRLNVVTLTMPPLRARREDIQILAEHFIIKASRKCKMRPKPLSPEASACLMEYDWPGNIRELENAIEHAMALGCSDVILPDDLPEDILDRRASASAHQMDYHAAITEFKKQLVRKAFQQVNGNYLEAARILGMHPNSLLRLIRNLELRSDLQQGSTAAG
jgi:Nif-specific regulatory protein